MSNIKTVTLPTPDGDAQATKEAQGEPWEIGYPWADDRFYGTKAEVTARMKRRIKQAAEEERQLNE